MKLQVVTIFSVLSAALTASAEPVIQWREVLSVSCQSGAKLNPAETLAPGTLIPVGQLKMDNSRGIHILKIDMTHDGSEYISGNPPCPKGDILIIQIAD